MKKIVRNILFEDPDQSYARIKETGYTLDWSVNEAYPFGYNIEENKFLIGERGQNHNSLGLVNSHGAYSPEYPDYTGRIWPADKVIAFWDAPNKFSLIMLLKLIIKSPQLKNYNFTMDDFNDFVFDIPTAKQKSYTSGENLFTLDDYPKDPNLKSFTVNRPEHVISPVLKQNKSNKYGFGSYKTAWDSPNNIKVRQAAMTSEGILLETPDHFDREGLSFEDPGAYAFGLNSSGKLKVGDEGSFHSHLSLQYQHYTGRIWTRFYTHAISFWAAPPKHILKSIIEQLNNHFQDENITTENLILEIYVNRDWKTYSFETYPEDLDSIENEDVPDRVEHEKSPLLKKKKINTYGFGSEHPKYNQIQKQKRFMYAESKIVKSTINESPDAIKYGSNPDGVWYDTAGAYGFGWIDGKLYLSNESETHDQMKIPKDKKISLKARKNFDFAGRVFIRQKILTFWAYPENQKDLYKLTKILDSALGIKISTDPEWKIEVSKKIGKRKDPNFKFVRDFIPLSKYIAPGEWSQEELDKEHIKSPAQKKKKNVPAGLGSKKYAKDLPLAMRQAMSTSESQIVRPTINESPDTVCSNSKNLKNSTGDYYNSWDCRDDNDQIAGYYNDDAYAFGIIDEKESTYGTKLDYGKFWLGDKGDTHRFGRELYKFAGRIWIKKRIISFWEFPQPNEMEKFLADLANVLHDSKYIRGNVERIKEKLNNFWIEIIEEGILSDIKKDIWKQGGSWQGGVKGFQTKFIKIKDYKNLSNVNQLNPEDLKGDHVKSPMDPTKKKKSVPYGFGSKHPEIQNREEERRENPFESFYPLLNEFSVGNVEIADVDAYIGGMAKGVNDKIDFISKINPDCIIDFGCANGDILNNIHKKYPNIQGFIGYDLDEKMINMIKSKYPDIEATDNWKEAIYLAGEYNNIALILMSVIHEVYTYGSPQDIHKFWNQQVFNPKFKYVVIRDMMPALEYSKIKPSKEDIRKLKWKLWRMKKYRKTFEENWGEITSNMRNMLHWLLKYDYKTNWEREVKENYFPVSIETVKSKIPSGWNIIHEDHYIFQPIANKVKRDFGIELQYPTHVKMIIENAR